MIVVAPSDHLRVDVDLQRGDVAAEVLELVPDVVEGLRVELQVGDRRDEVGLDLDLALVGLRPESAGPPW